jgi:hypothetical protein
MSPSYGRPWRLRRVLQLTTSPLEFRSEAIHLLARDKRPPAQIPSRNIAGQRPPGRHLYVCLATLSLSSPAHPLTSKLTEEVRQLTFYPPRHDR